MIRRFISLWILALPAVLLSLPVMAQSDPGVLAGQRQPTRVSIQALYQQLDRQKQQISEFSTSLFAYVPLGRNIGAGLRINQASADGDGLTSIDGLTDAQVALSYAPTLGSASLVFNLSVNLPSGKQRLTPDEFQMLSLLSLNEFGFQVPSFGQGMGLSPAVTLAVPLREAFVIGLGVAYQYRGTYEPLADMIDAYDPGDELLLTGGFDAQLTPRTTFSTDLSYAVYGSDTIGDSEVFEAGDRVVVSAQLRHTAGFNEVWFFARYRSRAKNSLAVGGVLVTEETKSTPNQVELLGSYRFRLHPRIEVGLLAEAALYEGTPPLLEQMTRVGGGIAPDFTISRSVRVPVRLIYLTGDITGFEAGVGLTARL